MDLQETRLDVGRRLAATCDVPDLELFPARYVGIQTVRFGAALEFRVQHLALWSLAALRRIGLPFPVANWAVSLNRLAGMFDAVAGEKGGMRVSVVGDRSVGGGRVRRTWQLTAPAMDGPEIPFMAANLLARRLARGEVFESGCVSLHGVSDACGFAPEFARWKITTRMEESPRSESSFAQMGVCRVFYRIVRDGDGNSLLFHPRAEDGRCTGDCSGWARSRDGRFNLHGKRSRTAASHGLAMMLLAVSTLPAVVAMSIAVCVLIDMFATGGLV